MLKVNYDTIKKNSISQKIRRLDLKILKTGSGTYSWICTGGAKIKFNLV